MMVKRLTQNLTKKGISLFAALLMVLSVAFVFSANGNIAHAENSSTDPFIVKSFTAAEFAEYRTPGAYTEPRYSEDGNDNQYLFAGWFQSEACTEDDRYFGADRTAVGDTVYAKFVNADVMTVKCNVSEGTTAGSANTNLRFISSVDSKNYVEMGFDVQFEVQGAMKSMHLVQKEAYKRLEATEEIGVGFSPSIFDKDQSEYFFTYRITNIGNNFFDTPFYVQPYWRTVDGTTVKGVSRYVKISDSYNRILNLPIYLNSNNVISSADGITVSYNKNQFQYVGVLAHEGQTLFGEVGDSHNAEAGTVSLTPVGDSTAADGLYANLRLKYIGGNAYPLEGITTFDCEDSFGVANLTYINVAGKYTGTPDTTWYDGFEDSETFVISSAADLYGFAKLVNDGKQLFKNKTVKLGADIIVNKGTINEETNEWEPAAGSYNWKPIGWSGGANTTFYGVFDGQGHTISGISLSTDQLVSANTADVRYFGLFGAVLTTDGEHRSELKNFKLVDSRFECPKTYGNKGANAFMGSVVGDIRGKITDVYSNAYVKSVAMTQTGGLIGRVNAVATTSGATTVVEVSGCQYDGTLVADFSSLTAEANQTSIGGLIAHLMQNESVIEDCLFTGEIQYTYGATTVQAYAGIGGLVGGVGNVNVITTIRRSMSAGNMVVKQAAEDSVVTTRNGVGIIFGGNRAADKDGNKCTINIEDSVYGVKGDYQRLYYLAASNNAGTVSINNNNLFVRTAISDCESYNTLDKLDYFKASAAGSAGKWVTREDNTPALKAFADQWIDVAWYFDDTTANNFHIKTAEEFYGFSAITNKVADYFTGKTVYLDNDIELNTGSAKAWFDGTATPARTLKSIASSLGSGFRGRFEGQNHTISGVYINDTRTQDGTATTNTNGNGYGVGLFGYLYTGSTVSNLKLTNSYIKGSRRFTGSIGGFVTGNLNNVYSDAYVVGTSTETGGLIGRYGSNSTASVKACEFAGTISGANQKIGGLVGGIVLGTKTVEDCLFSGTITSTKTGTANIGGIFGFAEYGSTAPAVIKIKNVLSTGTVTVAGTDGVGAVYGCSTNNRAITLTFENVYYVNDLAKKSQTISTTNSVAGCGSNTATYANVTGSPVKVSANDVKGVNAFVNTDIPLATSSSDTAAWYAISGKAPQLKALATGTPITDFVNAQKVSKDWYYNKLTYNTSGTQATTEFTISDADDMFGFANLVNTGAETFAGETVKLGDNIVFNNATEGVAKKWKDGSAEVPAVSWVPIGGSAANDPKFGGIFDGCGKTIEGMYLTTNKANAGLFGVVDSADVQIKNFRLVNSYFVHTLSGSVRLGSIAGNAVGTISGVYSDVILSVPDGYRVGGLVSYTSGALTVENCAYEGDMSATFDGNASLVCGGLIGQIDTASANVTIENCLYAGNMKLHYVDTVSERNTYGARIAGLVSFIGDGVSNDKVQISNCLSAGTIKATREDKVADEKPAKFAQIGTVLGYVKAAGVGNLTNVLATTDFTIVTEKEGAESSIKYAVKDATTSNSYSVDSTYIGQENVLYGLGAKAYTTLTFGDTAWSAVAGRLPLPTVLVPEADRLAADDSIACATEFAAGTGTESDPYIISTVGELLYFAKSSQDNAYKNTYFKLGNDIDLNPGESAADWKNGAEPGLAWNYEIGAAANGKRFSGHFDGDGKTISGVCLKGNTDYVGMFAATEFGSEVKNVRITNSYIVSEGATGYIGGLVSDCRGNLSNIYSNAIVESKSTYGSSQTGGLVGRANSYDYSESVAANRVKAIAFDNCWFDGTIYANDSKINGGIVGSSVQGGLTLTDCLYTGEMYSTHVMAGEGAYTTSTASYMGGIIGTTMNDSSALSLNRCVSAGKIDYKTDGHCVGSMAGYFAKGTVDVANVYCARDCAATDFFKSANVTLTGTVTWTHKDDKLMGYCTEEVVSGTMPTLNIGTNWVIRKVGCPVPKAFESMVETVDPANLNAELGLDTLSLNITSATHMGFGNYVLTKTNVSADTAAAYKSTLTSSCGFTLFSATDGASMFTKENGDWIVNVTYTTDKILKIAISNGISALSPHLVDGGQSSETGTITMAMLKLSEKWKENDEGVLEVTGNTFKANNGAVLTFGNSFVFELPNGHFIVSDGGYTGDMVELVNYMKAAAGEGNPVYIDAWTITHQHSDHTGALRYATNANAALYQNVYVEGYYLCEPSRKALNVEGTETNLQSQYRGMYNLRKNAAGEFPNVYRVQTGQRYYFSGMIMDIILSQEQIPVNDYGKWNAYTSRDEKTDFNTASTVFLFTTASGKKTMIGGDANYVDMNKIMALYGKNGSYTASALLQNIDVFQVFHHGKNMSLNISGSYDTGFVDYLWGSGQAPKYALYTMSAIYNDDHDTPGGLQGVFVGGPFPNAHEVNTYLNNKIKNANNGGGYYPFGNGNVIVTFSGDNVSAAVAQ